jgi:hypothetical protein
VLRRHEELVDAAVPVLVGAVIVVGEVLHGGHSLSVTAVLLSLAAAATLFGRRRWPGWTLAVSGLLVAVLFHIDRSAGTVAVIAPAVALYSLALTRGRRVQLLAGLAAVGAVLLVDVVHSGQPGVLQTLGHVLLVAIPLLRLSRSVPIAPTCGSCRSGSSWPSARASRKPPAAPNRNACGSPASCTTSSPIR